MGIYIFYYYYFIYYTFSIFLYPYFVLSPAKRKEIHRPPEKGMNSSNMCIFYKLAISIHKVKMKEKQRMEIKKPNDGG